MNIAESGDDVVWKVVFRNAAMAATFKNQQEGLAWAAKFGLSWDALVRPVGWVPLSSIVFSKAIYFQIDNNGCKSQSRRY